MKAQKGSITVMLILVLCAIVMAVTLVVEVARIKIAEGQAKRAVDTALFSALSSFDQDLKDEYGLFFRYGTQGLDAEIEDAVEKTLLINGGSDGWQPYGFQLKAMEIRVLFPLNDKKAIEHQIVEYMKYRGPAELAGEVVEKLGAFFSMQSTAKVMKADMTVDKKIKRLAEQIQALQTALRYVNAYSDAKLASFNGYAKRIAETAMQIETLENEAAILDSEVDREEIASIRNRIRALRETMNDAGQSLLEEITPVLAANETALGICKELKRLGPEIEAALNQSEALLDSEKHVSPEIRESLKQKYEACRKYCGAAFLNDMEQDLEENAGILKPKVELLKELMAGGTSGYHPPVFSRGGYKTIPFTPPQYPGSPQGSETAEMNLTPAVIKRLAGTVRAYIDSIKTSVWVEDEKNVLSCPGNSFSAEKESNVRVEGDDYDSANEGLASAYDAVGQPVDSGDFLDAVTAGGLNASDALYDSLLVNEYVLCTFNNRADQHRESHALKQTEVEYVLIGSESPQVNASISQLEIIAWRTVFNAVSFSCYCPEISKKIDGAAMALNALTGVPYPVWKGVITGLLSFIESYADTKRMIAGEAIPMFKFRLGDTSLVRECKELIAELGITGSESDAESQGSANGNEPKGQFSHELTVDYKDHLRAMLLYRSMLGQGDTVLSRIQDLVYTNVKSVRGVYDPKKHFNFIEADAVFTIKSFFPNLSGIKAQFNGIPMGHTIRVESGRGY